MIEYRDVQAAQARIAPHIVRTPLLRVPALDEALGCQVYLKHEGFQTIGAFKLRGALNKALSLSEEELGRGLVCASSGNHAQGVAYAAHKGFVPVRKKGKLPCKTVSMKYDLEYGSAEVEMHEDSIKPGQKVVIVDDLIATGGTTEAIVKLIEQLGGQVVKICFVMELAGLKGREHLKGYDVDSAIIYEGK